MVVRSFFQFQVAEGHLLLDPSLDLVVPRPCASLLDRAVTLQEMDAMARALDVRTLVGVRNRAILEVFFGCGLRRAELAALDVYDVNLAAGEIVVRRGKGGRSRVVPVAGEAHRWLSRYLARVRPRLARTVHEPGLFVGVRGWRLSALSFSDFLHRTARSAGLSRRVSPHRLRHGYATALIRGGADVRLVQRLLGHCRIATTQVYTVVDTDDLRSTYRRTHPRA